MLLLYWVMLSVKRKPIQRLRSRMILKIRKKRSYRVEESLMMFVHRCVY